MARSDRDWFWRSPIMDLIRLEGRAGVGRLMTLAAALLAPIFGIWSYRRRLRPRLLPSRGFDVLTARRSADAGP